MADSNLDLKVGHDEVVLRNRYESLSIANDILIGVWFLLGSILFFSESTQIIATWFFVLGSFELLIRPTIKLVRNFHVQRVNSGRKRPAGQQV